MNCNPYSPPHAAPGEAELESSRGCAVMFWMSCLLSVGILAIAANGGYQYWVYTSQAGIILPPHILATTVWVACSGLGVLYSASKWRRQLPRAGAISLGSSLLAFFVGPVLLPLLM